MMGKNIEKSRNNSKLVYIVLPVYNGEKYLLQQLMSIYYQDYKNWHLVIVNDGSTDSTESVISNFISNYNLEKKVTVINQANSGVNKSVEHGLAVVNKFVEKLGDSNSYVTFCDADDLLMVNKLSYQIDFMENHKDCDLSYHDLLLIDENNSVTDLSFLKTLNKNLLTNIKCDKFYEFGFSNHIPSNTPMFKANKIDLLIPFPKFFPFHDWWTALVFSGNNYKIVSLGTVLGSYRRIENGMSESGKKYKLDDIFDNFVIGLKIIKEKLVNKKRIKEIEEYIRYYENRSKWIKEGFLVPKQVIYTILNHPKIIIYKVLSYLKG